MGKIRKDVLVELLYLFLFLAVVVIWGTSTVLLFIEYSTFWAVISVVSYFSVFVGVFLIEKHTNNYKWKFLFLGKNFKEQATKFFAMHPELTKKEKKSMLKTMKRTYRQTGSIRFAVYHYQTTPYKLWAEDYSAFNYGNALENQKAEYMLFSLQMNTDMGGGLYRFFENITNEPFTYKEYKKLIKGSKLFSKEIKELLLKPEYEKIFEYFKKYYTLSDEEHKELENFELNDSNLVAEFDVELYNAVEELSVKNYLEYKERESLPPYAEKLYMSKDKTKRIVIFKDTQTNTYKINEESFVFYDLESSAMHSEGGWLPAPGVASGSSFYESVELAIQDNRKEIEKLEEISL